MRCNATALSNTTNAPGHGIMPPVMPNVIRVPYETWLVTRIGTSMLMMECMLMPVCVWL